MLALGLATSVADVMHAASHNGFYSVWRHMYLRRTFVTVYLTSEGRAVDCHKHYVRMWGYPSGFSR